MGAQPQKINMNSAMSKESAGAVFKSKSPWNRCRRKHRTNDNNIQREHTHNDMMQFTGKQREEANFKASDRRKLSESAKIPG